MADDLLIDSDGLGGRPGPRWRNRTDDIWYQLAPLAVFSVQCSVFSKSPNAPFHSLNTEN